MSRIRKEDRLHPVITLIVYWGEDKWQGAKSLHDILDFGADPVLAQEILLSIRDAATKASMTETDFVSEMHKAGY